MLGVKDRVVFTGFQSNPMPYIKNAKMLVLPSKSEAMNYVCFEAMTVKTPIIVSGFNSAKEFCNDKNIVSLTPEKTFISRLATKISVVSKDIEAYIHSQSQLKKLASSDIVNEYLKLS